MPFAGPTTCGAVGVALASLVILSVACTQEQTTPQAETTTTIPTIATSVPEQSPASVVAQPGQDPVGKSAAEPDATGGARRIDQIHVAGNRLLSGTVMVAIRGQVSEPQASYECKIEGRFFVDGDPDAKVLIYQPGLLQHDPVLPRDMLRDFPFTRESPRAGWFDIVKAGSIWGGRDCGDDFVVTASGRLVGLVFDSGDYYQSVFKQRDDALPRTPSPDGRGFSSDLPKEHRLVVLPDITIPKVDIRWTVPPADPDEWAIRWLIRTTQ